MRNEIMSLFRQAKKTTKLDSSTVSRDKLDDHVFDETVERAQLFKTAVETRPEIGDEGNAQQYVPHWDDLMHDLFVSYHGQDEPSVLPRDQIKQSREANRRVMQQILSTDEHRETRSATKHDPITSAFAAMSVRDKAIDFLQGAGEELAKEAQEAGRQEQKIENADDALEQLREQIAQQEGPATDEQKAEMTKAAKKKQRAAEELAKISESMQNTPHTVEHAKVLNEAAKEGKEAAQIMQSLPGMGRGSKEKMNPDDALRLAQMFRDNPILSEVAKLLGRMLRDMRFKRARRITGGREEVADVTIGDDLALLLPQELMAIRHPILKRDFYRRYHEKSLLQYELRGTEEVGFGPLVIVKDSSSSMRGQKHIWAVAVTMAMIAIANREKRDAYVIDYDTRIKGTFEFLHKSPIDAEKIINMASLNASGGTDTDVALVEAEKYVDAAPKFGRADIILISDGDDNYTKRSEELNAKFDEMGVRVHGVQIGSSVRSYLAKMCSHAVSAYDLTGANDATDLLATAVA
jgi:uncharacterized protein with von Willebrand factor type A (vWA) domain